jgi:hypothetical protein
MGSSALPSADRSSVWLADLIVATEAMVASAQPCDPAIVKAFSHRLEMRTDVRTLREPLRTAPERKARRRITRPA